MKVTREKLIENGWKSIGFVGNLEYLGRFDEFGVIQYVPVNNGEALGTIQSAEKELIQILGDFANERSNRDEIISEIIQQTNYNERAEIEKAIDEGSIEIYENEEAYENAGYDFLSEDHYLKLSNGNIVYLSEG